MRRASVGSTRTPCGVRRSRRQRDAGRVMLELPQDVVERLGLPTVSTVARARADGSRDILPVAGPLTVRICERRTHDGLHRRRRGRPSRGRPSRDHGAGPPPPTLSTRRWARGRSRRIVRCCGCRNRRPARGSQHAVRGTINSGFLPVPAAQNTIQRTITVSHKSGRLCSHPSFPACAHASPSNCGASFAGPPAPLTL